MPRGVNAYDTARIQGRLWTPAILRGIGKLSRWFDASDLSTISIATGISTWKDKAGLENAVQAAGGNQPPWAPLNWAQKSVTRVLPAVSVVANNQFVAMTTGVAYSGASGVSGMATCENTGSSTYRTILGGPTGALGIRYDNTNKLSIIRSNQAVIATAPSASATGARIAGFDAATSLTNLWEDGVATISNSTDGGYFANTVRILEDGAVGSLPFIGAFGELVLSTLIWSNRDRQRVEGYLAWKWGLVVNLPASHPFKNRPPLIGD